MVNATFTQWEFAWQPGIDQEEKLSSDQWAPFTIEVDASYVESAWYQEGDTYTLETFIDWRSFADGTITITPGQVIYLEARARDDDELVAGETDDTWETMFQWSTINYNIESDGIGFGEVTLSTDPLVGIHDIMTQQNTVNIYPNPSNDILNISFSLLKDEMVTIDIYDLSGKKVVNVINEMRNAGAQSVNTDISDLNAGNYIVEVRTNSLSQKLKLSVL